MSPTPTEAAPTSPEADDSGFYAPHRERSPSVSASGQVSQPAEPTAGPEGATEDEAINAYMAAHFPPASVRT